MEAMPQVTMAMATVRFKLPAPTGGQALAKRAKFTVLLAIERGGKASLSLTLSQPAPSKVSGGFRDKRETSNPGAAFAAAEKPDQGAAGPAKR